MPARLVATALDPSLVVREVEGPDAGAIVTFVGTVRDRARGGAVVRLDYEAYEGMALRQFEEIAREAAERFGARVAIHHRVGKCGVGDPTVAIAAASPHRAAAFDACRHAIERLKADAAVWKREVYADGGEWIGQGS